jgi:hypothetical protein
MAVLVDSQLFTSIQRCPARTNFYFNNDLRTPEVPASLQRGILAHKYLGAMYQKRKDSGNRLDLLSCANYALDVVKPSTASMTITDSDINNVFRSLEQYVELYQNEDIRVLFVEEPFAIDLYNSEEEDLHIVYVGVIDLIAKMGEHGEEKVYDHKTQSRRSDFMLLDDQFEGYATATNKNMLTVNVIGLQTSIDPKEKMRRIVLSYTPFLLERWKQHVIYWVKQYLVYQHNEEWPENHQGCNKFQLCEFYPICTAASDSARAWKMKSDFTKGEKWDPTKVLEHRE